MAKLYSFIYKIFEIVRYLEQNVTAIRLHSYDLVINDSVLYYVEFLRLNKKCNEAKK